MDTQKNKQIPERFKEAEKRLKKARKRIDISSQPKKYKEFTIKEKWCQTTSTPYCT